MSHTSPRARRSGLLWLLLTFVLCAHWGGAARSAAGPSVPNSPEPAVQPFAPSTWNQVLRQDFNEPNLPLGWFTGFQQEPPFVTPAPTGYRALEGARSLYMTGGGPHGAAPPGPFPDHAISWIESPSLNLQRYEEAYVEFWLWGRLGNAFLKAMLVPSSPQIRLWTPFLTGDLASDPETAAGSVVPVPGERGWRRLLLRVPTRGLQNGVRLRLEFDSLINADRYVPDEGVYIDALRVLATDEVDTDSISNDPYSSRQYELKNTGQIAGMGDDTMDMNVPEAWQKQSPSPGILVAILNREADLGHPDLNLIRNPEFARRRLDIGLWDVGTSCAGLVGAIRDNGIGVAGAAPGVKILALDIGETEGEYAAAIDRAVLAGANVLVMTEGTRSDAVELAALRAARAGRSIVLAAGDASGGLVQFDPELVQGPGVICVGGSSPKDEHKSVISSDGQWDHGSAYVGPGPDVCAPSSWSYTTDIRGGAGANGTFTRSGVDLDYRHDFHGTAAAASKVAGVAALLLSRNPLLTPIQVRQILKTTARDIDDPGEDDRTGAGVVDALAAVSATPEAPFTVTPSRSRLPVGGELLVSWTAPPDRPRWDWLALCKADDPSCIYSWWKYTGSEDMGTEAVPTPAVPGAYEIRYLLNNTTVAAAAATVIVEEAGGNGVVDYALIPSSSTVAAGSPLTIDWKAPPGRPFNDWIGLFKAGGPNSGELWWKSTGGASAGFFQLTAPPQGSYEFRYFLQGSRVEVKRCPLTVTAPAGAGYTVSPGQDNVTAGGTLSVSWSAPPNPPGTDWIALYKVGDPNTAYGWWKYTGGKDAGSFSLPAPRVPGEYQFRYLLSSSYTDVARSQTVHVIPPPEEGYVLTPSPTRVAAGGALTLRWAAPAGSSSRDWIALYRIGDPAPAYRWWQYTSGATSGSFSLTAPQAPGLYEFRYMLDDSPVDVKSSVPVAVVAAASEEYTLTPSSTQVSMGAALQIQWTAPAGSATDWIGLFQSGSPNTAPVWWVYTGSVTAGSATLEAPRIPGEYEFRYLPNNGYTDVAQSATVKVQ